MELPDSGEVWYKDRKVDDLNFPYINDLFFVHEKIDYVLPINMDEYIRLLKAKIPKWDQEFFDKMIRERKIDLGKNFKNYSRGQKMQIILMMGLASNASTLLLDEITSVIDVYGRKYFLDIISKYVQKGNTAICTTNIINELEFYTDNLIILKNKKILLNKPAEEIPKQYIKIRKIKGTENHPVFSHKDCLWAGVNSDRSVSYVIPTELAKSFDISQEMIDRRKSTLEDIFLHYFHSDGREDENAA